MPVKSKAQFKMMEASAHNGLKNAGPSKKVAKEFLSKTSESKKKMFAKKSR